VQVVCRRASRSASVKEKRSKKIAYGTRGVSEAKLCGKKLVFVFGELGVEKSPRASKVGGDTLRLGQRL